LFDTVHKKVYNCKKIWYFNSLKAIGLYRNQIIIANQKNLFKIQIQRGRLTLDIDSHHYFIHYSVNFPKNYFKILAFEPYFFTQKSYWNCRNIAINKVTVSIITRFFLLFKF
jgi:hypothetical protein